MTTISLSDLSAITLRCALEVTMIAREFTRIDGQVLDKIARTGRAYTNETKHIANELIEARRTIEELRTKLEAAAPTTYDPYAYVLGGP